MDRRYLIYKITNFINQRCYIGMMCETNDKKLGLNYFSSSTNRDFIKDQVNNPHDFGYRVMIRGLSLKDAKFIEPKLIKAFNDNSYNNDSLGAELSSKTKMISRYVGKLIKASRKESKMSMQEVANRLSISRGLVQRIEQGNTKSDFGTVIEIMILLGIPIFGGDGGDLNTVSVLLDKIISFMPKTIRKTVKLDDDF